MEKPVLFSTIATASGHRFGRATLNAPASLNALSLGMVDLLDHQLGAWAEDPGVAGVILDATGAKAFCAGGDVQALHRSIRSTAAGQVPVAAATFFEREYRLDHRIHRFPKPVLCWGHGIVMGGGIGLMAGASHRVATLTTRLAMPEIGIGLFPDVGASWFLQRMPGRTGLFVALTGAPLNAADACFAGLADVVLRDEQKDEVLQAITAAGWAGDHAEDHARLGRLLRPIEEGVLRPFSNLRQRLDRIDQVIGDDSLADVALRLRTLAGSDNAWLKQAGTAFANGSPTSAALAFTLQRRTRHLSLADVFRLEYQAAVGCCMHHDFAEGVRALLIDKDKRPHWQPPRLEEVSAGSIDAHLAPRFTGAHPLADLR